MADKQEPTVRGSDQEQSLFADVYRHYTMAREDVDRRRIDWDKKDILFRSHIVKENWPYRSLIVDPRIFTGLYEKTARTFANKPRGRMQPRESGDALGAKINNEILNFQWDDNERVDDKTMLAKWATMDLNTRKYGASFGLAPWHWQRQVKRVDDKTGKSIIFYDGPNFKPWPNRDVLHNPSYDVIKNWIQLRSYVTLQELEDINDAARSKPIYKNLDILKDAILKQTGAGGDLRSSNYVVQNLTIKGLQDYLGRDPVYKTIELVTEYRNERWITFAPKHGVIIRDIPNPYDHCQIPVVLNKYISIDDDIYGLSEIEPVEKLAKGLNAYICQNLDQLNLNTYVPLKVRNTNGAVQMHTLQFGPGSKWLMNDPASDVIAHNQGSAGVEQFVNVYRLMVSAIQEGLGETSADVSNQVPGAGDKTATEIKDNAFSRSARDNFTSIFLGESMKKQMMFWYKMNQQFFFNKGEEQKIIRIVGKDAIKFFQQQGLDGEGLSDDHMDLLQNQIDQNHAQMQARAQHIQDTQMSSEDQMNLPPLDLPNVSHMAQHLQSPLYPVKTGKGVVPKLQMDEGGQTGKLIVEKQDLSGDYDYIPDVGSMGQNASQQEIAAKGDFLSRVTGVDPKTGQPTGIAAMMAKEGKTIKATDLIVDYAEDIGFKNADQYIENMPQQTPQEGGLPNGQAQQAGAGGAQAGSALMGNVATPGIPTGAQALSA